MFTFNETPEAGFQSKESPAREVDYNQEETKVDAGLESLH